MYLIPPGGGQRIVYSDAGGQVAAVAGAPDAVVVVAGTTDGRLVIWYGPGAPHRMVQLTATARQVAAWADGTIVVRTDLGLLCLSTEHPPG